MWLIPDEIDAIDELEQASDRSVAVITGAILDSQLTDILRNELSRDDADDSRKVLNELFQPDGPLGSFGAKISLAYLLGYFTPTAHKELQNLKTIRNLFAHYSEHNTFISQRITALCANLKLIDTHVTGSLAMTNAETGEPIVADSIFYDKGKGVKLALVECEPELAKPRGRFTLTAKLFCAALYCFKDQQPNIPKPIL